MTDPSSDATPTTPGRSRNMAAIRRANTKPEVELRRVLHAHGLRFRKDYPIRLQGRLIRPDVVFTRRRLAVFVDGCFWHSCPDHGSRPRANTGYWNPKLAGNVERDLVQTELLKTAGWHVARFWAHDRPEQIATMVAAELGRLDQPRR